jgi:uncharacterized membrane protein YdjX (TVP38/TMEM64 family)
MCLLISISAYSSKPNVRGFAWAVTLGSGLWQFPATITVQVDAVIKRCTVEEDASGFGGGVSMFFGEVVLEVLRGGGDAGSVVVAIGTVVGGFEVFVHGRRILGESA